MTETPDPSGRRDNGLPASSFVPLAEVDDWLVALRGRWENPRISHRLAQIAGGGEQKIPARIGTVIQKREEAGLPPGTAELETIAAWERFKENHQ